MGHSPRSSLSKKVGATLSSPEVFEMVELLNQFRVPVDSWIYWIGVPDNIKAWLLSVVPCEWGGGCGI